MKRISLLGLVLGGFFAMGMACGGEEEVEEEVEEVVEEPVQNESPNDANTPDPAENRTGTTTGGTEITQPDRKGDDGASSGGTDRKSGSDGGSDGASNEKKPGRK